MKKQILKYSLLAIILLPIFMAIDLLYQWIAQPSIDFGGAAIYGVACSVGFTVFQIFLDRRKKS